MTLVSYLSVCCVIYTYGNRSRFFLIQTISGTIGNWCIMLWRTTVAAAYTTSWTRQWLQVRCPENKDEKILSVDSPHFLEQCLKVGWAAPDDILIFTCKIFEEFIERFRILEDCPIRFRHFPLKMNGKYVKWHRIFWNLLHDSPLKRTTIVSALITSDRKLTCVSIESIMAQRQ